MRFLRILIRWPKNVCYYRKISKSIDFMIRYFILWISHLLDAISFNNLRKLVNKLHVAIEKDFIFKTKFWIFLWRTFNHWTILEYDYEPWIKKVINNNYKKNHDWENIFINIWSHIGRYGIELTKNYWYQSYCFEPFPDTFKYLKINTILSNVEDKINIYNYALWDRNSEMLFEHIIYNEGSNRLVENDKIIKNVNYIKVPVKTFDSIWLDIDPQKTKLIIMDVEWFEFKVLKWMENFLKKTVKIDIIIEIWEDNKTKNDVIKFMKGLWFSFYEKPIDLVNYLFYKN